LEKLRKIRKNAKGATTEFSCGPRERNEKRV